MAYNDKKGQGFDTFKLLIAAVVAMVILGIVSGVFGKIWDMIRGISCVGDPIGEIVSTISRAQTGIATSTQVLCLKARGDSFSKGAIEAQLSGAEIKKVSCAEDDKENQVCKSGGSSAKLSVSDEVITALDSAQFRVRVCCGVGCTPAQDSNSYCELEIFNA